MRTLRNILSNVEIKKAAIDRRMQRGNLILSNNNWGSESPLAPCECYFFDMIMKLSRCRHSIAASEGLELINSLIKKTEIEKKNKIVEAESCLRLKHE